MLNYLRRGCKKKSNKVEGTTEGTIEETTHKVGRLSKSKSRIDNLVDEDYMAN
jgi:hypothetical protein